MTKAGWKLVALTNGSNESTRMLLEQAGALQHFTKLHSCDEIQITKPHPNVYQLVQQNALGEIWMIAAHAWDIAGAIRAGLKTAFITSEEKDYLSIYPQPDVIAPSLMEAANQIIGE